MIVIQVDISRLSPMIQMPRLSCPLTIHSMTPPVSVYAVQSGNSANFLKNQGTDARNTKQIFLTAIFSLFKILRTKLWIFCITRVRISSLDLNPQWCLMNLLGCCFKYVTLDHKTSLKGTLHFFLKIGSFYNSPRVKQLSFTVFESIQLISGSGGSTFSLA